MPAAAVIPAPIAYINVVAVKKLVVEVWVIAVVRLRSLDSKSPPSSILMWVFTFLLFSVRRIKREN